MNAKRLLILLATIAACTPEETTPPEMIVVEGWIESGAAPVVMVSTSIVPTAEKQELSALGDHIVKWARVAISDGTKEVVLTGKPARDNFPPYLYTTGRMFGEPGKTYTLTVDTDKYHCEARTVIPKPAELDGLEPVTYGNSTDEWLLKATWHDDPAERNAYRLYSMIQGVDSLFSAARINYVDDEMMAGDVAEVYIFPSRHLGSADAHAGQFYSGETVHIKFCTLDPDCAGVIKDIDESVTQSKIPLFVSNRNIHGNINGGLGYFIGLGRTLYTVKIPD